MSAAPSELVRVQTWFSRVLRAPLDPSTRTLQVVTARWPAIAITQARSDLRASAAQRLAVYNRQYWFRLYAVFAAELPLTGRLLGLFRMNQLTQSFLVSHPPRTNPDLGRVVDGFAAWLTGIIDSGQLDLTPPLASDYPLDALREAVAIDEAHRVLWVAPEVARWRPSVQDAPRLAGARLLPSSAVVLVDDSRGLLELRRAVVGDDGEDAVVAPAAGVTRTVALVRLDEGTAELPLVAEQALLYRLLGRGTVAEAIAALERELAPTGSTTAEDVQRWLALGVEAGFWSGMAPGDASGSDL